MKRREFIASGVAAMFASQVPGSLVALRGGMMASTGSNSEEEMYKELYETLVMGTIVNPTNGNGEITSIRSYGFCRITSLTQAIFPNVTTAGNNCFQGCTGLTDVYLPNLTTMGGYMFESCTNLVSADLPLVTSLGDFTFYNNKKLSSLNAPCVTSLALNAVRITSLVDIYFPAVTTVGVSCFQGNTKTRTITIPIVESISSGSFEDCRILEVLDMSRGSAVAVLANTNAFTGVPSTCKFVVPDDLVDSYKVADNWSTYASQIIGRSDAISGGYITA